MRRLSILVVVLFTIGCSSHSVAPAAVALAKPQVFQGHGGGQWVLLSTHHFIQDNFPLLHWFGSGMTGLGPPGTLLYINESGTTTAQSEPFQAGGGTGFVVGPDGNLWVSNAQVYSITRGGVTTTYPTPRGNAGPITIGPDGAMWFGESPPNPELGRVTTAGVVTEIPFQSSIGPYIELASIVTGSDGNFWAYGHFNGIDRITPTGVVTNFTLPGGGGVLPNYPLVPGPDGAVWFDGYKGSGGYIGQIKIDGTISQYDLPKSYYNASALAFASDGLLWVSASGELLSFDPSNHQFSAPIPEVGGGGSTIAQGPDGNLWLTSYNKTISMYLRQSLTVTPSPLKIDAPGLTASLYVTETNYQGDWSGSSHDKNVATVKRSGTRGVLTVTAVGVGTCILDVGDSMYNWVHVKVTVQ